jgi:HK97 gp10 family phage protein
MTRVSVSVKRRETNFNKVTDSYRKKAIRLIGQAGNMVRNTAVNSIQQGSKDGKIYQKYIPRRTHQASADGQPPATDTGFLVQNINLKIDIDKLGASVESNANYSAFLEFGTRKMAARPFMQPALEENRPKIRRKLSELKL